MNDNPWGAENKQKSRAVSGSAFCFNHGLMNYWGKENNRRNNKMHRVVILPIRCGVFRLFLSKARWLQYPDVRILILLPFAFRKDRRPQKYWCTACCIRLLSTSDLYEPGLKRKHRSLHPIPVCRLARNNRFELVIPPLATLTIRFYCISARQDQTDYRFVILLSQEIQSFITGNFSICSKLS